MKNIGSIPDKLIEFQHTYVPWTMIFSDTLYNTIWRVDIIQISSILKNLQLEQIFCLLGLNIGA